MAVNDIRVWSSPHGQHGEVAHGEVEASATFLKGEPVCLATDTGQVAESTDDPTAGNIIGIALEDGVVGTTIDWRTDAALAAGATVSYVVAHPDTLFITANHGATSEQFDNDLAMANIGDEAGLELVSGSWGINVGATNNTCRIVDLLNADYNSIQGTNPPGGTTVAWVVFRITQSQVTGVTPPA